MIEHAWWPNQPVLEVKVNGSITTREQALALTKGMVDEIEAAVYNHVIVILDLSGLVNSPAAGGLLAGSLPQTYKIEHLVMINAPGMLRMATMPLIQLRNKLHFLGNTADAKRKATELLPRLPK